MTERDAGLFDLGDRRISRRELLRMGGRGGMGVAAAAFLAACGGAASGPSPGASGTKMPPLAHEVDIAQWPLYLDKARGGHRPSLEMFEKQTGINVQYREIINDNQDFFAKLVPQFQANQATGWDIITLSDWVVTRMDRGGWLETLDFDLLPNVTANMLPAFRDPAYDANNAHSVPWQGGVTGIAYNPTLTGRKLTSVDDLWDENFAGHVGMLTEMVDTMSLTLLSLGVEPSQATIEDATRAKEKLIQQRDAGIVRKYYGQDYTNDMVSGNTWATMAWSGDVFFYKYLGGAPDLEFIVPDEGGMLWATPSEIPIRAQHPRDAHAWIDFFYQPEMAALVTDWVLYMTPVKGVQEIMQAKADNAKSDSTKRYYDTLASSPMLFPPEDLSSANLHEYKALSEQEFGTYNQLFTEVTQGV